ncbi:MAG: amidase [Gammaproteobacteria bacterium]|nr:amidase [Gammaproteobacteria bacterium]
MHSNSTLATATLGDLVSRIARGELTAEGLLTACLERIAANDTAGAGLHAFVTLNPDAGAAAIQLDAERRKGRSRGPLHGIPLVVKDNIDVGGLPTSSGNPALLRAVATRDAAVVARLRAAGAIIVGKTNLSEFSFEIRSRSSVRGDVRNPFDPRVTAGGSSGGTAAAVAAGFAVAGLGTDTGGSIRVPAAYTGLVGIRPTHGSVDTTGVAPLAPSTDTVGPIARCVEDAALLLRTIARTPGAVGEAPAGREASAVLKGTRIGVLRQAFGTDSAITAAMDRTLDRLRREGVRLDDPIELPAAVVPVNRASHVVDWEFRPAFDRYLRENFRAGSVPTSLAEIVERDEFLPEYREVLRRRVAIESLDDPVYREILAFHQALARQLDAMVGERGVEAIVYPTSMVLPSSFDNPAGGWAPELAACSGRPAITIPIGVCAEGLPIGLELLGARHGERRLLSLARAVESISDARPIAPLARAQGSRQPLR